MVSFNPLYVVRGPSQAKLTPLGAFFGNQSACSARDLGCNSQFGKFPQVTKSAPLTRRIVISSFQSIDLWHVAGRPRKISFARHPLLSWLHPVQSASTRQNPGAGNPRNTTRLRDSSYYLA